MTAVPVPPDPAVLHLQLVDELLAERYGPLAELEREAVARPQRDGAGCLRLVTEAATTPGSRGREVRRHG